MLLRAFIRQHDHTEPCNSVRSIHRACLCACTGGFDAGKLLDGGEGNESTIAGGEGAMWTTLLQIGELLTTARRALKPSEARLLVSNCNPILDTPFVTILATELQVGTWVQLRMVRMGVWSCGLGTVSICILYCAMCGVHWCIFVCVGHSGRVHSVVCHVWYCLRFLTLCGPRAGKRGNTAPESCDTVHRGDTCSRAHIRRHGCGDGRMCVADPGPVGTSGGPSPRCGITRLLRPH